MSIVNKKLYNEKSAGCLYSVFAIVLLLVTLLFSGIALGVGGKSVATDRPQWYIYLSYLVSVVAFALVFLGTFCFVDVKPKQVFLPAKPIYFLMAVVLQFGLFSLNKVNAFFVEWLQSAVGYTSSMTLPDLQGGGIVLAIFVIAFLPAVCEELFFRGVMLTPMRNFSMPVAILLSGALFALYHQSPAQTIYQFICGCLFAWLAFKSNSPLPTMLSHFLNNAVILVLYRVGVTDFTGVGGIIFYVLSAIALIGSLVFLFAYSPEKTERKTGDVKSFVLFALPGIAAFAFVWVLALMR